MIYLDKSSTLVTAGSNKLISLYDFKKRGDFIIQLWGEH